MSFGVVAPRPSRGRRACGELLALPVRSGPAAVAPIRQALDRAAPGQARDDLAAALARLDAS
ncbi:hypothetical protein WJ969_05720 [Achromobacter xylosoxidans]